MSNSIPIGLFDSGLGGLTVLQAMCNNLPGLSYCYLGDTAHVPYGNKSPETIRRYSRQCTAFLAERQPAALVVACNTASAVALDELRSIHSFPIIGMIDSAVEAALRATKNSVIGVLGTHATIESGVYCNSLSAALPSVKVVSAACPLFVPLVEEGWISEDATRLIVKRYLEPLKAAQVDTVILGCTHYPVLKKIINQEFDGGVTLIDTGEAAAHQLKNVISDISYSKNVKTQIELFVTDIPRQFDEVARHIFGSVSLPSAKVVHLD